MRDCHSPGIGEVGLPEWSAIGTCALAGVPPALVPLIELDRSLTVELRHIAPKLRLRRVRQGLGPVSADEAALLGGPTAPIRRAICFDAGDAVLLAAHTVYDGAGSSPALAALGQQSLSDLLFPDGGEAARMDLRQVCRLRPGDLAGTGLDTGVEGVPPLDLQGTAGVWARRSRFWLNERPLLVTEVFLPALLAQLQGAAGDRR